MAIAHHSPPLGFRDEPAYRRYLFTLAFGMLFLLFLAAPWPLTQKAHVVLHGLCAQRPSHTLLLSGQPLPFDARMTGIYSGFLVSGLFFAAKGRYRASRLPSIFTMFVLGLFVTAMAIDGTNSLLLDLLLWHPYEPDNTLRLATGLLAGIALATVVTFLLASTLWRHPDRSARVVTGPVELVALVAIQLPFALASLSGRGVFLIPLTLFLLIAAVLALTSIMLATVVLFRRQDGMFTNLTDLQGAAFTALLVAVAIMAIFGGGRFILEHFMGPPAFT